MTVISCSSFGGACRCKGTLPLSASFCGRKTAEEASCRHSVFVGFRVWLATARNGILSWTDLWSLATFARVLLLQGEKKQRRSLSLSSSPVAAACRLLTPMRSHVASCAWPCAGIPWLWGQPRLLTCGHLAEGHGFWVNPLPASNRLRRTQTLWQTSSPASRRDGHWAKGQKGNSLYPDRAQGGGPVELGCGRPGEPEMQLTLRRE